MRIVMARRPARDERSVYPDLGRPIRGQRVWMVELAEVLRFPFRGLNAFARKHGLLKYARRIPGYRQVSYVTEHGAARLIIYARQQQGEALLEPKSRAGKAAWWRERRGSING